MAKKMVSMMMNDENLHDDHYDDGEDDDYDECDQYQYDDDDDDGDDGDNDDSKHSLLQTSRTVRRACILNVIFFETQMSEMSAALKETAVPLEGQNKKRLKTPWAPENKKERP